MIIKISVIVPIYNTEKYLGKCIDSIVNQTYKNLEIILVDDGSPDKCGVICDEYAKTDDRIRVVHKTNGGLSDARNAGMRIATGEYFAFIDSDDWIEPQMFERLIDNVMRFNAEISVGGVVDLLEKGNDYIPFKSTFDGEIKNYVLDKKDAMKKYFLGSWSAWDKIYRRDLFEDIRYPVGEINEDEAIVLKLLDRCSNVCYTNEVLYNYVHRPKSSSITASAFSSRKLAWHEHCKSNLDFIKQNYSELTEYAEKRYYSSVIFSLTSISFEKNKQPYKEILQELKSELKDEYRNILKNPYTSKREKIETIILHNTGLVGYSCIIKTARAIKGALRKNVG